mmetsp:Transcript_11505/g.10175  ORF Transcript_11505/g.10175 Transcript_11505/m.10175 type:complete len:107 (+) Transcript_11505:986-1306(+)
MYPGKGHERFIWLQIIGFVLIIFGTLMYNEIIILPFLGMNLYTEDTMNKSMKIIDEPSVRLMVDESSDMMVMSKSQVDIIQNQTGEKSPLMTTHTFISTTKDARFE